jgi:rubrerythrin
MINAQVLVDLLIRALWIELEAESNTLWSEFLYASDELREVANVLRRDSSQHEKAVRRILRSARKTPPSYIEERLKSFGSIPPITSDKSDFRIIDKAINLEKSARDVYKMIVEIDEEAVKYAFEIPVEEFRSTIAWLVEEEEKHIKMLEKLKFKCSNVSRGS